MTLAKVIQAISTDLETAAETLTYEMDRAVSLA
jgi:hypothetical protein